VIKNVEELPAELERETLSDVCLLCRREIDL
jgi:hypothetical protein